MVENVSSDVSSENQDSDSSNSSDSSDSLTISINRNWFNAFNLNQISTFVLREWRNVQMELIDFAPREERSRILQQREGEITVNNNDLVGNLDSRLCMEVGEWHRHCATILRANSAISVEMLLEIICSRVLWMHKVSGFEKNKDDPGWNVFCAGTVAGAGTGAGVYTKDDKEDKEEIMSSSVSMSVPVSVHMQQEKQELNSDDNNERVPYPNRFTEHDAFSKGGGLDHTPDTRNRHIFPNFLSACTHYKFPGSHQHGSWANDKGIIRTYSNSTLGKDHVLQGGREILYRLKNSAIQAKFNLNMQTGQPVHFFRKVVGQGQASSDGGGGGGDDGGDATLGMQMLKSKKTKKTKSGCKDMGLYHVKGFVRGQRFVRLLLAYADNDNDEDRDRVSDRDGDRNGYMDIDGYTDIDGDGAAEKKDSKEGLVQLHSSGEGEGEEHPIWAYKPSQKDISLYRTLQETQVPLSAYISVSAWTFSCKQVYKCLESLSEEPGLCRHLAFLLSSVSPISSIPRVDLSREEEESQVELGVKLEEQMESVQMGFSTMKEAILSLSLS